MSIQFGRDLEALHADLRQMGQGAVSFVRVAMAALEEPSGAAGIVLEDLDEELDRLDVQLEEQCLRLLALHQPVACDLRHVAAILKINGELERIADLSLAVTERAAGWGQAETVIETPPKLLEMARQTLVMVERSVDAYQALDAEAAWEIRDSDDIVDALHREVIQELTTHLQHSPATAGQTLMMFSACRDIERIADHATNIAEDIIYMVHGTIIRHQKTPARVSA